MKKIVVFLILVLCLPVFGYDETPTKKPILITLNSRYYQNASQVVEGFFKQSKIFNYSIDIKLEKEDAKNFRFTNKTIEQSSELLSKLYNITIESNDKKDFYIVTMKEKK
jgi:hypothetical protein